MIERADGETVYSALYFDGSSHGSPLTLGGMICKWPTAAYPSSQAEESAILESVRKTVSEKKGSASPVAAIVIEPTQYTTGYTASSDFISSLYKIAGEFDAALVVDETSTCCGASGKGFFQYQGQADFVAFGKRMQATGFFSNSAGFKLGGNENDVKLFKVVKQGMDEDQLISQVSEVSTKVQADSAQVSSVNGITGVRCSGTSLWVDTDSPSTASALVAHLRSYGVLAKVNGTRGIVARPALIFGAE